MKEKILENRKKILIIGIAVILILGIGIAIALQGNSDDKNVTDVKSISTEKESVEEETQIKELEAEMEEELEAAKTDEEKQKIVDKYAEKKSAVTKSEVKTTETKSKEKTDKKENQSFSKPQTTVNNDKTSSSQQTKPSKDENKEPERVWVEEKGHYEQEPIYEYGYKGYWIKDADGVVFFKTKDPMEIDKKLNELWDNDEGDFTWGCNLPDKIIGYRDVWVIDEEGHWEYR